MSDAAAASVLGPVHDPLSPTQKPATQTLEGKLSALVTVVGAVLAFLGTLLDAGVFGAHDGKLAMIIGSLVAFGSSSAFGVMRTLLKSNANESTAKAAALIATAKADPSQP